MKQTITEPSVPIASICINRSRIKVYNKEHDPTYYLQKGSEFQIELFNPTQTTILAKIKLNGNPISKGGLVLRPAERVFLERYVDVAKKFLFDTYEVSNTIESQKAIEKNGDFSVEFFKESVPVSLTLYRHPCNIPINKLTLYNQNLNPRIDYNLFTTTSFGDTNTLTNTESDYSTSVSYGTTDEINIPTEIHFPIASIGALRKIETGRVEAGSDSSQQLMTVNKEFDYYPFHKIEYKLLPISQKVNTINDINVKVYCTSCGHKAGKTDKFCSSCGYRL